MSQLRYLDIVCVFSQLFYYPYPCLDHDNDERLTNSRYLIAKHPLTD